jgi:hypothetical protein
MSQPAQQPWPNQEPVVDGVTPLAEVPQTPDLFDADDDDLDREMDL